MWPARLSNSAQDDGTGGQQSSQLLANTSRSAAPTADREVEVADQANDADRKAGLVFVAAMSVATVFAGAVVFFSLPANLLWTPRHAGSLSRFIATQFPEKWAFFTKAPQSSQYGAYRLTQTAVGTDLLQTPQTLPRNAFGLSRTQRAQGAELAILGHEAAWESCNDYLDVCLQGKIDRHPRTITNATVTHTICGHVLLTEQKLIPWSFRNQSRQDTPWITQMAQVQVRC